MKRYVHHNMNQDTIMLVKIKSHGRFLTIAHVNMIECNSWVPSNHKRMFTMSTLVSLQAAAGGTDSLPKQCDQSDAFPNSAEDHPKHVAPMTEESRL